MVKFEKDHALRKSSKAATDSGQDSSPIVPWGRMPTHNAMSAPREEDLALPSPVESPRAETDEAGLNATSWLDSLIPGNNLAHQFTALTRFNS